MNRLRLIKDALSSKGIDGLLVSEIRNVRYLSGFTGSSGCLLVTRGKDFFFTDFRYEQQACGEVRGVEVLIEREERPKLILATARDAKIKTLGFEAAASYAFYRSLVRRGLRIKAVAGLVEEMRRVKDKIELASVKKAITRAEEAFTAVRPQIRKGLSERAIALRLEEELRKGGCSSLPFDIIIAAGPNAAMPHAKPTDRIIKAGDFIVADWGGESDGYFSDMTRTLLVSGPHMAKKREIYETVLRANTTAIGTVRDGVHARQIDKAARDVIETAGYGDFFGHGTGHGVGLDVHELPRVSALGKESVRTGMVFTIEPGIYLPGIGGVRIEDMVAADKTGCEVLTRLPKELDILQ